MYLVLSYLSFTNDHTIMMYVLGAASNESKVGDMSGCFCGISRVCPIITGVIIHLLDGMYCVCIHT